MDGRLHLNPSVVIAVPFLRQSYHLLRGGVGIKAVVLVKHSDGTGDIALDARIRHTLADIVREIIHIGNGGGAEPQAFRQAQQSGCTDRAAVPEILFGEDVVAEPILEVMVVAIAPQWGHGKMGVAVNEAGHQHHASAVDDSRCFLLGGLFGNVGNLAVGYANICAQNHRELVNHGDSSDVGKQSVHRTPFESLRGCRSCYIASTQSQIN